MQLRYAKEYVDRVCEKGDLFALYEIVKTLAAHRQLSERFELLLRTWEWCCSNRSGVWQYYATTSHPALKETSGMMKQYGLDELNVRYRSGIMNWGPPSHCGDLGEWIETHWSDIEMSLLSLVADHRAELYG